LPSFVLNVRKSISHVVSVVLAFRHAQLAYENKLGGFSSML